MILRAQMLVQVVIIYENPPTLRSQADFFVFK